MPGCDDAIVHDDGSHNKGLIFIDFKCVQKVSNNDDGDGIIWMV